ncbi:MAG: class I SAM-dependent methyltransferase [Gallionellaceae bacterium]
MAEYTFTANWTDPHRATWEAIINKWQPIKILEIGAFEGRTTCFLIEQISKYGVAEICCVDTWEGGEEHFDVDMQSVEQRFIHNTQLAIERSEKQVSLKTFKGFSTEQLPKLLVDSYKESFDLVYVDGSHQAPDVLFDCLMAYHLCKKGGVIICDDYVWRIGDVLHEPKIAIDSFVNIFRNKVSLINASFPQLYLYKND